MERLDPSLDFDGIAGPVEGGRLSEKRSAAAAEHASDQPSVRVIIRHLRIFIHVESGEAASSLNELSVAGVDEPLQEERRQSFAVMKPVEADRKLFVIHPVAG